MSIPKDKITNDELIETIKFCSDQIVSIEDLEQKLSKKQSLTIKAGFDPTSSQLHLGHWALFKQLEAFSLAGHQIVFLVGDFTAQIGDPTGKNITRPQMTEAEVIENAKSYTDQVKSSVFIEHLTSRRNSEWMSEFGPGDWIKLASQYSVSRMLERDDFKKRFHSQQSISIHEFLYPLVQGYDSVALSADVELGGSDQLFNVLMGRTLQKNYGQEQQVVITYPLLVGTDGVKKMSKSYDNYIGLKDTPGEIFSKIVSLPDSSVKAYLRLLTSFTREEVIEKIEMMTSSDQQKEIKVSLARNIIEQLYDKETAEQAHLGGGNVTKLGDIPEMIKEITLRLEKNQDNIPIAAVVRLAGLAVNSNAVRDAMARKIIYVDGVQATPSTILDVGKHYVVQCGKKQIAKVHLAQRT